jgi:cell fate (sporulation/competence/biofilm development) regulator YmcA (YheA/YmcA/DUF963 family)
VNNLEELKNYLSNDAGVKRLHELEKFFDNNKEVFDLINKKKEISKQLVNARYLKLFNQAEKLKKEYDDINQQIYNYPLLAEYLELLDNYHNDYLNIISYIEKNINRRLN